MYPEDRVLVAYVPSPEDFDIVRREGWYRIPQRFAPKGLHAEYLALGSGEGARCAAYRGLCDEALEPSVLRSIRHATHGGYPLASETFKATVLKPAGCRTERGKPGPRLEQPNAVYACEPA